MLNQKRQNKKSKKAVFFTTDALIALIIILLFVVAAFPVYKTTIQKKEIHRDVLNSLSSIKMSDIQNLAVVQNLISNGNITNLNKTALEQIGEFYVSETTFPLAVSLANALLAPIDPKQNVGIWFGDTLIASKNITPFDSSNQEIDVTRESISGIQQGNSSTGYTARSTLSNTLQSKYFYFGGYIGDGNISALFPENGEIVAAYMEMIINKDFDLYINENLVRSYEGSIDDLTPIKLSLDSSDLALFNSNSENKIEFKGNKLYIAGGFIRLDYAQGLSEQEPVRIYFPGVKGITNIYDGIYIPGDISSMKIYLKFNGSLLNYLTLGNTTIYEETIDSGNQIIQKTLTDSDLSGLYSSLSNSTTPIRLGLGSTSKFGDGGGDVILVTDYSGSMKKALVNVFDQGTASLSSCEGLGSSDPYTRRDNIAECLDYIFVNELMNESGNRIWPIFINGPGSENQIVRFTGNPTSKSQVLSFIGSGFQGQPKGKTCISCSINEGYNILNWEGDPNKKKFIVLMTDGVPNYCSQGSCSNSNSSIYGMNVCLGYCDTTGNCGGSFDGCTDNNCEDAITNSIYSATRAFQDQNITIFTIGFGITACSPATQALEQIASITGGKFYASSDAGELEEIYKNISGEIKKVVYDEQTAISSPVTTELYPDSYIEYSLSSSAADLSGLIINAETQFSSPGTGSFSIPENSTIVQAVATSYSGSKWTQNLKINEYVTYNLTKFGSQYLVLGDPFRVGIPNKHIQSGNTVEVSTANSPGEEFPGSQHNKIIYTIRKNFTGFSKIVSSASGCTWNVTFEDDSSALIKIPSTYNGPYTCKYGITSELGYSEDALQLSAADLLSNLDLNNNGKLDVKLTEQNIEASLSEIQGIPFLWKTEVQIRTWR